MGKGRIWPLLLRFSGPSIVSALVSSSYNLVDAVFVGRLGPEALGALAIAFPLMIIYTAVGMGIAIGSASLISRNLGAGNREQVNRTVGNGISLFFIIGAIATLIFYFNLEPLLRLFGATDKVLELAMAYMKVETGFIVLNLFLIVLVELVRAEGNPVLSSAASITSGVVNCIMDPILIFGIGFFPTMGIAGAAVATSVGRAISIIILIVYLASNRSSYHLRPQYFVPNLKIIREILRVGASSMVRMSGGSIVQVLADREASSFGVIPLAVLGVLIRVSSFAFQPCFGMGQGMLPLVGYNYGAKQNQRVGEIVTKATIAAFIWGVLCWIIALLLPTPILSIFGSDPNYLAQGTWAFRIFAFGFFTVGAQMVLSSFFQGLGKGMPALIVSSSRQVIFLIPGVILFPWLFGLTGLWLAFPIADALALILSLAWIVAEFRRMGVIFSLRSKPQPKLAPEVDPLDTQDGK
jgi:putative MATE family efflux protein